MALYDDLADLLEEVANRVNTWTDQATWTFEAGSPAAVEVANTEVRQDGSPWGDRPVRSAYALAQMATMFTIEMARSAAPLVRSERPPVGIESLARTSLEAGSLVWWLLEGGLKARQRVCRMQLLRLNNARELAKSIAAVGEDPSVAGNETIPAIQEECRALGLAPFGQGGNELEGERRLGYTARVAKLAADLGNHGGYNIYSGVAHAELSGLWRLFRQTGALYPSREPIYRPAANPEATFAAVDNLLKPMIGPMVRITLLFGWTAPGRSEEVGATMDYINEEMTRLHP